MGKYKNKKTGMVIEWDDAKGKLAPYSWAPVGEDGKKVVEAPVKPVEVEEAPAEDEALEEPVEEYTDTFYSYAELVRHADKEALAYTTKGKAYVFNGSRWKGADEDDVPMPAVKTNAVNETLNKWSD